MFGDAFHNAWMLIRSGDSELWLVVLTSLRISLFATMIAAIIGVPIGYVVASSSFPGRRVVITLLNTLQALPTVVIGLILYGLLSRSGPLGPAGILYTRLAVTIGEAVLIVPIIAAYTMASVAGVDPRIRKTARSLGARHWRESWLVAGESRFGIAASIIAGFGRAIGEVGIAMMLGGNIQGFTRTITTAIALEHNKGNFALGLALGVILFCIALAVNGILHMLQGTGKS